MLNNDEFLRLQKLACIQLNPEEEAKLWKQLDNIIQFLGQLDQIKVSAKAKKISELTLRTISGVREFPDAKKLLDNVQHPIVNNSIVIKSVLS